MELNRNTKNASPHLPSTAGLSSFQRKVSWAFGLLPYLGVVLFIAALFIMYRELHHVNWHQVHAYIHRLSWEKILLAAVSVAAGYCVASGYDFLGIHFARKRGVPWKTVMKFSFTAYAFSNNFGHSAVTGTSVRMRRYTVLGFTAPEVLRVLVITFSGPWMGFTLLAGFALLASGGLGSSDQLLSESTAVRVLGVLLISVPLTVLLTSILWRKPVRFRGAEFTLPSWKTILAVILVSLAEWSFSATVLYALLPAHSGLSYFVVIQMFLLAQVAGIVSQVPGGVGIFEAAFLLQLPPDIPHDAIAGALILYRLFFYLVPCFIAFALMGWEEIQPHRGSIKKYLRASSKINRAVAPPALAIFVFMGGVLLLISAATPELNQRLRLLSSLIPVGIIQASHFFSSVLGVVLLVLSSSIYRRVKTAYDLAIVLLPLGALFLILKGGNWEQALVLLLIAAFTYPARPAFTRQASLISRSFSKGWWLALVCTLVGTSWLGLFCYKHVDYRNDLWWQFELDADAPRFLRMQLAAFSTAAFFGLMFLLRSSVPKGTRRGKPLLSKEQILEIVRRDLKSDAWLAVLGDKLIFPSLSKKAFLMYAYQGKNSIVMGDPVGPEDEWRELLWLFKEKCSKEGSTPVFYEVNERNLHYYVELGLAILKIGESGRVDLKNFSLEGKSRTRLRQARNKAAKDHVRFEYFSDPEKIRQILPNLKEISDSWLRQKSAEEKGFTLGFFNEEYLLLTPIAVAYKNDEPVAFANLWLTGERHEMSPDLMRFDADKAPEYIMDFLFTEMMLLGKELGYSWFSLGMAPLSGLEARPSAPLWNKLGSMMFMHGGQFYHFEGLRAYKDKFLPRWEGRYIASQGGVSIFLSMMNCAALIAGGSFKKIFVKG